MMTLCFRGVLALLCLGCLASYVQAEDNNNGQQAADEDEGDEFYRHGRQFYRFGRAFSPLWDNEENALIRKNHLLRFPGYPISPVLDNEAFSRPNREFYRFGRAYPAYQDKRFLRFGRPSQTENDEIPRVVLLQSDNQLYRKRRSAKSDSQSDESSHQSESAKVTSGRDVQKRETTPGEPQSADELSYNINVNEDKDLEKRFMRFGKRFMRFGRGNEEDADVDKRFMRFGKSVNDDQDYEKRFMRFGKSVSDDQEEEKRFMRFGKSLASDPNYEKRFMRFGKRFMRFGRGIEDDENEDKRFMRFGKSSNFDGDFDKRFMRFGKRFMRFGRGYEQNEDSSASDDKEIEDKRFMRFGKRSKRASTKDHSNNSDALTES
uniref:FMRFamide n=1 Tax=Ambigolimax valentianus TaxID=1338344 RepID=D4AHV4_9EUPU|nr:FMRFamide precursor [Ambigolimax valentianus]